MKAKGKQKLQNKEQKDLLSKTLDNLYLLEDKTGYDNKRVGIAIDKLQELL